MTSASSTVNILLVEDDHVDTQAFMRSLAKQKIVNPVLIARDGIEALEILRGQNGKQSISRPYVIMLDLNMPRMDGFQFLAAVREDPELRTSLIFVLTTSNDEKDKAQAYDHLIAGYFLKSDVADGFMNIVQMIEHFVLVVQFPNHNVLTSRSV